MGVEFKQKLSPFFQLASFSSPSISELQAESFGKLPRNVQADSPLTAHESIYLVRPQARIECQAVMGQPAVCDGFSESCLQLCFVSHHPQELPLP